MDDAFGLLKHLRAAQRPADNPFVVKREAPLILPPVQSCLHEALIERISLRGNGQQSPHFVLTNGARGWTLLGHLGREGEICSARR